MNRLTIWTKTPAIETLTKLHSAIAHAGVEVCVSNDFTTLPEGVILGLGEPAKEFLMGHGVVPKKRTTTSLRNQLFCLGNSQVLLSYSPDIKDVDYGQYVDLLCDARTAVRVATTGTTRPKLGTYEYVKDFSKLIAGIEAEHAKTEKPVDVCHDTETHTADPWHPDGRFVSWQFSHQPGYSAVRWFENRDDYLVSLGTLWDQIVWLFTSPKVNLRMANGKYDAVWHYVHTRQVEITNFNFDSYLVGSVLDENRSNSLKVHARIHTEIGGYEESFELKADKGQMGLYPADQDFLEYAGGDTDAGLQVAKAMREDLIKDPALTRFYVKILHPAARAYEVIERGGVLVDMERYKQLEYDLDVEIKKLTNECVKLIGGRLYAKHQKEGEINLTKKSLLVDFLFSPSGLNLKPLMFTEKDEEPSTNKYHLRKFRHHPEAGPFVRMLEEYTSATKAKSTYVIGFQKHLRSDGRFHPSYFLFSGEAGGGDDGGTVTGRRSCKSPAFQTMPKRGKWGKELRKVFIAPKGFVVCERDYNQGELRVVADIANETTMLAAYAANRDLHVVTGAKIAGLTYEQLIELKKTDKDQYDSIRDPAKPANFGLIYGQFPESFRDYAENGYGVVLTLAQATQIRESFFDLYPKLVEYHTKMKSHAKVFKYVRSPLGRVRRLPLINSIDRRIVMGAERQAINSPVQSTLGDLMAWSIAIDFKEGGFKAAPCFGEIHDAAYDYLPEDNWEQHARRKINIMENLPLETVDWKPKVKFRADCKIGPSMGELKEVSFT